MGARELGTSPSGGPLNIAVVGTGISGMAAAWLLSSRHRVTVFERDGHVGGHSNTVDVAGTEGPVPVDTGFIVYNETNYPNLTALFDHLGVATEPSDMSFSASLDDGRREYAGTDFRSLFAQRRNLVSPRFWRMLGDVRRFYRDAPGLLAEDGADALTLGEYLAHNGYSRAFLDDHLLPMAAAIWSTKAEQVRAYPAAAFIRFFDNHGLLRLSGRPAWRTVTGGSREYVRRLTARYADRIRLGTGARTISRAPGLVTVIDDEGVSHRFDHVVVATHADQALALLDDPTDDERRLLRVFRYRSNVAVLHSDQQLMPRRPEVWASWNYVEGRRAGAAKAPAAHVTYWMNRLQGLAPESPLFVTLNPLYPPRSHKTIQTFTYEHPLFDCRTVRAQRHLWSLQGRRNTWYCGCYFGAGFHEDGLQAGLAVAEDLGGVRRPWSVDDESGRIVRMAVGEAAAA